MVVRIKMCTENQAHAKWSAILSYELLKGTSGPRI